MNVHEQPFEVRVEVRRQPWQVAAWAASERLDRIALVVDFRRLRSLIEESLDAWEEADGGSGEGAPELAAWMLERLGKSAAGEDYAIVAVEAGNEEGVSFIALASGRTAPRGADPDRSADAT